MNKNTIEGNWKQLTGKVKARWGKLTGNESEVIDGKLTEASGKVQKGYGVTTDVTERQIDRVKKGNNG